MVYYGNLYVMDPHKVTMEAMMRHVQQPPSLNMMWMKCTMKMLQHIGILIKHHVTHS